MTSGKFVKLFSAAACLQICTGFSVVPTQLQLGGQHAVRPTDTLSSLSLFFTPDRSDSEEQKEKYDPQYQQLEFRNLEPLPENEARRERIKREIESKSQFEEFGDKLWDLRKEMDELSTKLISAIQSGENKMEEVTREQLRHVESRDPELVYSLAVADYEKAKKDGDLVAAKKFEEKALLARNCLPQFNLDGLWVGKYGSVYELINITYIGDTLIAEKVTGDENVPRGEITFQVDLNPLRFIKARQEDADSLKPIQLTEKAAMKWGTRKLPRYPGLGQVAEAGFMNNQWLDGQLILIGEDYFSFAWLPIEQQIFFGRPSPELALKMMREAGVTKVPKNFETPPSMDEHLDVQKEFAMRCLYRTHEVEDELEHEAVGGIYHPHDEEVSYFE